MLNRCKSARKIIVEPQVSLVTDRISIYGEGFEANEAITIQGSVNCESEKLYFESFGHFMTSQASCYDLSQQESVGGTYTGIDEMGLFWSAKKIGNSYDGIQMSNASETLNYTFSVFNGHLDQDDLDRQSPISSVSIQRTFLAENVKRYSVEEGNIRGTLFVPPGKGPFPAIMILHGGIKRKHVVEDTAALLANNGYVTFGTAFFGVDGFPKKYTTQPIRIEYFEEVLEYLSSLKFVISNKIGVYGTSKGGDIALAMMAFLSNISAVAVINSCISSLGTSTTYGDRVIDMLSGRLERIEFMSDVCMNTFNSLNHPYDEPSSIIPFETSMADLLMVAGLDDYNWNSELFADLAKEKMDAVQKRNYQIIKYPDFGHNIDAPYTPSYEKGIHPLFPQGMFVYYGGKNRKAHAMQQVQIWNEVISFFNKSLKNLGGLTSKL